MTKEEYMAAVIKVGEAFKALPDDKSRMDVLVGLCSVMKNKANQHGLNLLKEWMEQAYGTLQSCHKLWDVGKKD